MLDLSRFGASVLGPRAAGRAARSDEVSSATPNHDHASFAAVRLLREVVDYERRLRHLNTRGTDAQQAYLHEAYRRALALRRDLIHELPRPPERTPSPWPGT